MTPTVTELVAALTAPSFDLGFEVPTVAEVAHVAQEAGVSVRVLIGMEDAR